MLTYSFENIDCPVYEYLYKCIKDDILSGTLAPGEKLPSKRMFAKNNGTSTITIQNAYDQLISEGYIYTLPKKGYYVAEIEGMTPINMSAEVHYDIRIPKEKEYICDFTSNEIDSDNFPFSVWAKISREIISGYKDKLMKISPAAGVFELRKAIADHLKSFRGLLVDPDQIIIGAGTEYLYSFIIELLGKDKIYTLENPGYKKLIHIYGQKGVECSFASIDDYGVTVEELRKCNADVAHICPNHHFPTGINMPASRRYELLAWANEKEERYIVEDDYDSEFRIDGKPIPPLFSIDACNKVIYMNTFSKSLTPTIRVSYMVLPVHLANKFYRMLSFYSCTVSNFEQYTLAEFIAQGYFEKHINRMRLHYSRKRKSIINSIEKSSFGKKCRILENDAGLHFLIEVNTDVEDCEIIKRLDDEGIRIKAISDYYIKDTDRKEHCFIINYSNMDEARIDYAMNIFEKILDK